jgi:hypothetical protein
MQYYEAEHGYGVRETTDQHQRRMPHMDHMEDPKMGYVTINDLHVGKTIGVCLTLRSYGGS